MYLIRMVVTQVQLYKMLLFLEELDQLEKNLSKIPALQYILKKTGWPNVGCQEHHPNSTINNVPKRALVILFEQIMAEYFDFQKIELQQQVYL